MLDLTLKFKSLNHVKCMTRRGETSSSDLGRGEIDIFPYLHTGITVWEPVYERILPVNFQWGTKF